MAVKTQTGFEAQAVARAKADRQHGGIGQQRGGETFGIFRGHRNLESVLAGVAGA